MLIRINPARRMRMAGVFAIAVLSTNCSTIRAVRLIRGGEAVSLPQSIVSVPYRRSGNALIVEAHINHSNRAYSFLVDTGALSIVDPEVADELGLVAQATGQGRDSTNASQETGLTRLDHIAIAPGIGVHDLGVAIIDLTMVRRYAGVRVDGIIGSNFLRHFRVLLDYSTGKIDFLPAGVELTGPGRVRFDIDLPMKNAYAPSVDCMANGQAYRCLIDTGSNGGFVIPAELTSKDPKEKIPWDGMGALGIFAISGKTVLTRLGELRLGNLQLQQIPAITAEREEILVGRPILSTFRTLIDYPGRYIVLVPNGVVPHDFFSTGILLLRETQGPLRVLGVLQGSPASGILSPGDEILQINDTRGIDLPAIYDLLEDRQFSVLRIKFKNSSGVIRTVTVNKAFILPGK